MSASEPVTPDPRLIPADQYFLFPPERGEGLVRAVGYVPPRDITNYWVPSATQLAAMDASLFAYLATRDREPRETWSNVWCQAVGVMRGPRPYIFASYFVPPQSAQERAQFAPEDPRVNPGTWRSEPFWVNDGGEDYFRVLYDTLHREFTWYEQNNPGAWGP